MSCRIGSPYVVKVGDFPYEIARRELGDGNRWKEILKTDGSPLSEADATTLQPGQLLCIPGRTIDQAPTDQPPGIITQVLQLINNERSRAGLPSLRLNAALTQAAQGHGTSMAYQDFFSHRGIDGSTLVTRIERAGYRFSTIGENIAAGQGSAQEVVRAWMNSEGHRRNILNPQFIDTGIGYEFLANDTGRVNYYHYWAQTFGAPA